jgi:hypothetical protein
VIVVCVSAIVLFSLCFAPNRGLLWAWFARRRKREELMRAMAAADAAHGGPRVLPGEASQ